MGEAPVSWQRTARQDAGVVGLRRIGQKSRIARGRSAWRLSRTTRSSRLTSPRGLGARLLTLDEVCAAADCDASPPSTTETRHLFNDERFARCKPGIRIINTARGELIAEDALRRAIDAGIVAGAGLDVFEQEPPSDWSLAKLPQVIGTPHIAASTEEAQELVGLETAMTVRDFLRDGTVRNAVNFPSTPASELQRLQPWIRLADHLGSIAAQMARSRVDSIGVRYYGALAEHATVDVVAASATAGVLRPILSNGVTIVNARAAARERAIDVVQSRGTRRRDYLSLLSIKLRNEQRRPRGRGHGVRGRRACGWSACRASASKPPGRHDGADRERRSAGRDRRSRRDFRPARGQHRQLRARTQRYGRDRRA